HFSYQYGFSFHRKIILWMENITDGEKHEKEVSVNIPSLSHHDVELVPQNITDDSLMGGSQHNSIKPNGQQLEVDVTVSEHKDVKSEISPKNYESN
ncbi:hypothetical protein, partial [Acinetobacter baumannii]|uniref:hypothetical protein n=1 Tax=Acinetobacter baumannii TaxID=470 RepID=UPI001C064C30